MSMRDACPSVTSGGTATYRIIVQGFLSEHWRNCLAGLAVVATSRGPDDVPRTTLVGRIRSQAELSGVLDTLYGLHLPILKVETIDEAANGAIIRQPHEPRWTH